MEGDRSRDPHIKHPYLRTAFRRWVRDYPHKRAWLEVHVRDYLAEDGPNTIGTGCQQVRVRLCEAANRILGAVIAVVSAAAGCHRGGPIVLNPDQTASYQIEVLIPFEKGTVRSVG